LQASGHRFDPDRLHHLLLSLGDEETKFAGFDRRTREMRIFDIVNGFLIDAVAIAVSVLAVFGPREAKTKSFT
jgi:hypothetical protein